MQACQYHCHKGCGKRKKVQACPQAILVLMRYMPSCIEDEKIQKSLHSEGYEPSGADAYQNLSVTPSAVSGPSYTSVGGAGPQQ